MNVRNLLLGLVVVSLLSLLGAKEAKAQFVSVTWGQKNPINYYCSCGGYQTLNPPGALLIDRKMYFRKYGTIPWKQHTVSYSGGSDPTPWQNATGFGVAGDGIAPEDVVEVYASLKWYANGSWHEVVSDIFPIDGL